LPRKSPLHATELHGVSIRDGQQSNNGTDLDVIVLITKNWFRWQPVSRTDDPGIAPNASSIDDQHEAEPSTRGTRTIDGVDQSIARRTLELPTIIPRLDRLPIIDQ
jgi:hypothetical protein